MHVIESETAKTQFKSDGMPTTNKIVEKNEKHHCWFLANIPTVFSNTALNVPDVERRTCGSTIPPTEHQVGINL